MTYTDIHHPDIPPQVFQRIRSYARYVWRVSPIRTKVPLADLIQEAYMFALAGSGKTQPRICVWNARDALAQRYGYQRKSRGEGLLQREFGEPNGFFDDLSEQAPDGTSHDAVRISTALRYEARLYMTIVQQRITSYVYRDGLSWYQALHKAGKARASGVYKQTILKILYRVAHKDFESLQKNRVARITQEATLRGLKPSTVRQRHHRGLKGAALWTQPYRRVS